MNKKYRALIYCDLEKPDLIIDNMEVTIIHNVRDCLNKLSMFSYDIVIIQMYKEMSNICEIISCIRMITFVPILFLVTDEGDMKKQLIHAGVDMVINKNSSKEEVGLLIFSMVRRYLYWSQADVKSKRMTDIRTKNLVMDRKYYRGYWKGVELQFTRQEYDFLYLLASAPMRVYTYEQIYQLVWKEHNFGDIKNIIWCLVKRLRKKLDIVEAGAGNCIVSVREVGYKFELNTENEKQ